MTTEIPAPKKATQPMIRQDRVRLSAIIYRKKGMSVEEFSKYWREEHAKLFANLPIVKKNLLKYEQSHVDTEAVAKLNAVGTSTLDCDGIVVMEAANWDRMMEVLNDKEYQETVVPDSKNFLDEERTIIFPSHIVGVFDDPS